MKRQIIRLTLVTLFFYAGGRLGYEHFYRLAVSTVKSLSTVPIHFFGKYPFWFFGDPAFGLITASIPLSIFAIDHLLANSKTSLLKTISIYLAIFTIVYFTMCWVTSMGLLASNDFYKDGDELSYNLRQVNLNHIYLTCIGVSAVLTTLTILGMKVLAKYRRNTVTR